MRIPPEEVRRIAGLARLDLSDEERAALAEELSGILDHVELLRSSRPSAATPGVSDRDAEGDGARPPAPGRPGSPDALERDVSTLAPRWVDGFFVVPPAPGLQGEDDG